MRGAFASASPHARVSLMYLDGRPFAPYAGDDMAVIVAGLSDQVGAYADELRAAGATNLFHTPKQLGDYILGISSEKR